MEELEIKVFSLMKDGKKRSMTDIQNSLKWDKKLDIGVGAGAGALMAAIPVLGIGVATAHMASKSIFDKNLKKAIDNLMALGYIDIEDGKYVITAKGLVEGLAAVLNKPIAGTQKTQMKQSLSQSASKQHNPYEGDKPFIFVSYSHKNNDEVMEVVTSLQDMGYRVWYDEGIDPGTEWADFIAQQINKCGFFISFISEEYIDSDNCKDELEYSRDLGKDRILIYLHEVQLSGGMAMRHGRIQAIHKYKYSSMDEFTEKLMSTPSLDKFRD